MRSDWATIVAGQDMTMLCEICGEDDQEEKKETLTKGCH